MNKLSQLEKRLKTQEANLEQAIHNLLNEVLNLQAYIQEALQYKT